MTEQVQTPQKRLYKSRTRSWKYFFKDGSPAIFVNGWYATADQKKIAEIQAEIDAGHPEFFVDPNEAFLTVDRENPIAALEKKIRQQILAEMAAASGDPTRDMGQSVIGKLNVQSTKDIAAVTHGNGPATVGSEKLAALMQNRMQVPSAPKE